MNFKDVLCGLLTLILTIAAGCVNLPETEHARVLEKPEEKETARVAEHFRRRAENSEIKKDWYMAREFLRVAEQLGPEKEYLAANDYIVTLTRRIESESDRFYQIGLAFYEKGINDRALGAFLQALRINPEHEGAISYTVDKLQNPERKSLEVTKENNLSSMAEHLYDDHEKSFLIAYFNDMKKSAVAKEGPALDITPVQRDWDRIALEKDFDVEKNLEKAREHLEAEQYENAIELAVKIQEHDPENSLAAEIKSEAWLQIARHYEEYKKYPEALDAMTKVDPDYKPAQIYMAHLQKVVKALADHHYKTGVQLFVDENLEKAIVEWEQVLALDPNNQKARQDIENAKKLLEKLGKIK